MNNILTLKKNILSVIRQSNYDVNDLTHMLDPLGDFVGNELFMANLKQIVEVIVEDRDGDSRITWKDIEMISEDVFAITTLIKGILLILSTIPQLKMQYNAGATEELIFKMLAYIFLVMVPEEANLDWTSKEKEQILDLVLLVYDMIKSSQIAKDLVTNIIAWLKETRVGKMICGCGVTKEEVVEQKLPRITADLRSMVTKNKNMLRLKKRLEYLENKYDEIEFVDTDED